MTLTTVGYGDVTPHTRTGKVLGTLLVLMGVFCLTSLLAEVEQMKQQKKLGAERTLRQRLEELQDVVRQDDNGSVTVDEYIIFILRTMGKVDDETLGLLRDQFEALDADGSGDLDGRDVELLVRACECESM